MHPLRSSTILRLADRLLLNTINRQLEDPDVSTERLFEMLSELKGMGRRYEWEMKSVTLGRGTGGNKN